MRTVGAAIAAAAACLLSVAAAGTPVAQSRAAVGLACGITAKPFHAGKPIFGKLRTLNARFLVYAVEWSAVATERPENAINPTDAGYDWKAVDRVFSLASASGIEIVPLVFSTPSWANGGKSPQLRPTDPQDYADFLVAMSTRYPQVRRWMIWGEPSRAGQWQPQGKQGAQAYAVLLDKAYVALRKVGPRDLVIGGNTQPSGDDHEVTSPASWLRRMVLPNGRRPRFDLWGHNPFTERPINLRLRPSSPYTYDFNDIDTLAADLDRYYPGRRIRLFLSETGTPTEHANSDWFFVTSRADQAARTRKMLQIARSYGRVAAFSNYLLYDDAGENGWTTGLLTARGVRKPAWGVYKSLCSATR